MTPGVLQDEMFIKSLLAFAVLACTAVSAQVVTIEAAGAEFTTPRWKGAASFGAVKGDKFDLTAGGRRGTVSCISHLLTSMSSVIEMTRISVKSSTWARARPPSSTARQT